MTSGTISSNTAADWRAGGRHAAKLFYWKPGNTATGHVSILVGDSYYSIYPNPNVVEGTFKDIETPHHKNPNETMTRTYPLAAAVLKSAYSD